MEVQEELVDQAVPAHAQAKEEHQHLEALEALVLKEEEAEMVQMEFLHKLLQMESYLLHL